MKILLDITSDNKISVVSDTIHTNNRTMYIYLGQLYKQLSRVQRASFLNSIDVPLQQFLRHVTPSECPTDPTASLHKVHRQIKDVRNGKGITSAKNINRAISAATTDAPKMSESTLFQMYHQVDTEWKPFTNTCYTNTTKYTRTLCPSNIPFLPRRVKSVSIVALMFDGAIFDINCVSEKENGYYVAKVVTSDKSTTLRFKLLRHLDGNDKVMDRQGKNQMTVKFESLKRARSCLDVSQDEKISATTIIDVANVRAYRGPLIHKLLDDTTKDLEFNCHKVYNCIADNIQYPSSETSANFRSVEKSALELMYPIDYDKKQEKTMGVVEELVGDKCCFHGLPAMLESESMPELVQGHMGPSPQYYRIRRCDDRGLASYLNGTMFPTMPYHFEDAELLHLNVDTSCENTFITASMLHDYINGENQTDINVAALEYGQRHEVDGLATLQVYFDKTYQASPNSQPMRQVVANTKCKSSQFGTLQIGATPDGFVYDLPLQRTFDTDTGTVRFKLPMNSRLYTVTLSTLTVFDFFEGIDFTENSEQKQNNDIVCTFKEGILECKIESTLNINTCVCIGMTLYVTNQDGTSIRWVHTANAARVFAVAEVKSRYKSSPPAELSLRQHIQLQTQMYVWKQKYAFLISWGTSESRIFETTHLQEGQKTYTDILEQAMQWKRNVVNTSSGIGTMFGNKDYEKEWRQPTSMYAIRSYHQVKRRYLARDTRPLEIFGPGNFTQNADKGGHHYTLTHPYTRTKIEYLITPIGEKLLKIVNKLTGHVEYAPIIQPDHMNDKIIALNDKIAVRNVSAWQSVETSMEQLKEKLDQLQRAIDFNKANNVDGNDEDRRDNEIVLSNELAKLCKTMVLRLAVFARDVPIQLVLTGRLAKTVAGMHKVAPPASATQFKEIHFNRILNTAVTWYTDLYHKALTMHSNATDTPDATMLALLRNIRTTITLVDATRLS